MDCSAKDLKAYRDLLLEKGVAVSLGEPKIAAEICRWALPGFDQGTANLFVAGRFSSGKEELLILPPDEEILRAVKRGLLKAFPARDDGDRTRSLARGAAFALERAGKQMRRKAHLKDPTSGKAKGGDPKVGDVLTIVRRKDRQRVVHKVTGVKRDPVKQNRLVVAFEMTTPDGGMVFTMVGREADRFFDFFREHGYEPGSNCTVDLKKVNEIIENSPKDDLKNPGFPERVYVDLRHVLDGPVQGSKDLWEKARARGLTDDELEMTLGLLAGERFGVGSVAINDHAVERKGRGGYKISGKKFHEAVRWALKVPRLVAPLRGAGVPIGLS